MLEILESLKRSCSKIIDIEQLRLNILLTHLEQRLALPSNIELTHFAGGYFASVFNQVTDEIISEQICMGFDLSASLASLKGLVEFLERMAFEQGTFLGLPQCNTLRSDGFAAFPYPLRSAKFVRARARANALNEAIERYCWSVWWDNHEIQHKIVPVEMFLEQSFLAKNALDSAHKLLGFRHVLAVLIEPANNTRRVVVLLAETKAGGFVTGGASGEGAEFAQVMERASAELYRHCLALKRMRVQGTNGNSFYQKRLAFFGFGDGAELVRERISKHNHSRIELPPLMFDCEIPHSHSDLVYVHRCLFQNQPVFVGGDLERLCI